MVHRRRHQGVFRAYRSPPPEEPPAQKYPRQPLPAVDRRSPQGRILRSMDLPPITKRYPSRWDSQPYTINHLSGSVRQICRDHAHARLSQGRHQGKEPGIRARGKPTTNRKTSRRPGKGQSLTTGAEKTPLQNPRRPRVEKVARSPLGGRWSLRIRRPFCRSPPDESAESLVAPHGAQTHLSSRKNADDACPHRQRAMPWVRNRH